MTSQIKAAIGSVILVLFLLLGYGTYYYHNEWVVAKEDIAKIKAEYTQIETTAKACSENTAALASNTATKDADIKKAQGQAAVLAKANESLAQALLGAKAGDPDSCRAAVKLYQDYKNKVIK